MPVLETVFCIAILIGNGYTTYREIQKAPYREENFEKMAEMAPQIPFMSESGIKRTIQKEIDESYEIPIKERIRSGMHSVSWKRTT